MIQITEFQAVFTLIYICIAMFFIPLGIAHLDMIIQIRKKGYFNTKNYKYTRIRRI